MSWVYPSKTTNRDVSALVTLFHFSWYRITSATNTRLELIKRWPANAGPNTCYEEMLGPNNLAVVNARDTTINMCIYYSNSLQAQTYLADFEEERKDREAAHSKIADMENRYGHQLEAMKNDLHTKSRELDVNIIIIIVADSYQ